MNVALTKNHRFILWKYTPPKPSMLTSTMAWPLWHSVVVNFVIYWCDIAVWDTQTFTLTCRHIGANEMVLRSKSNESKNEYENEQHERKEKNVTERIQWNVACCLNCMYGWRQTFVVFFFYRNDRILFDWNEVETENGYTKTTSIKLTNVEP